MGSRERPQPSAVSLYPGASGRLSLLYAPPPPHCPLGTSKTLSAHRGRQALYLCWGWQCDSIVRCCNCPKHGWVVRLSLLSTACRP